MKEFRASIDIGSNTVVYLIAKNREIIKRGQFVTSLGLDLDKNKSFSLAPMKDTLKALTEICKIAKKFNINESEIIATATEASRVATNGREFYDKVLNELSLNVKIINSDQEAYYSAQGLCFDKERDDFVCLDIGGASTEFIKKTSNESTVTSISLPVGSVRLMSWKKLNEEEKLVNTFNQFDFNVFKTQEVIGVAGTMTAICMMIRNLDVFDENEINDQKVTKSELLKLYHEIVNDSPSELLLKYPHLGKRSKVIKEGIEIGMLAMDKLNAKTIEISTRGVCFGTINGLNY